MTNTQFLDAIKNTILQAENSWFTLEYEPQIYLYLTGHGNNVPAFIEGKEDYTPTCGDAGLKFHRQNKDEDGTMSYR
jgi:hypothetical protein